MIISNPRKHVKKFPGKFNWIIEREEASLPIQVQVDDDDDEKDNYQFFSITDKGEIWLFNLINSGEFLDSNDIEKNDAEAFSDVMGEDVSLFDVFLTGEDASAFFEIITKAVQEKIAKLQSSLQEMEKIKKPAQKRSFEP